MTEEFLSPEELALDEDELDPIGSTEEEESDDEDELAEDPINDADAI